MATVEQTATMSDDAALTYEWVICCFVSQTAQIDSITHDYRARHVEILDQPVSVTLGCGDETCAAMGKPFFQRTQQHQQRHNPARQTTKGAVKKQFVRVVYDRLPDSGQCDHHQSSEVVGMIGSRL